MLEIRRIAANVATPLALLGLIAALAYLAYARKLKYQEAKLEALPSEERAKRTDEYLTRYGIDGKRLPIADKLALIRDEMDKRYRLSFGYVMIAAAVFVICFGMAVVAYAFRGGDSNGTTNAPTQTRMQVFDALTKDPIYRPLTITYAQLPVPQTSPGQITLPADLTSIDLDTLKIVCPGYSFTADKQAQLHKGFITLDRVPAGQPNSFKDAITPGEAAIEWVAIPDYEDAVKGQVVENGIKLRCFNRSDYQVNLVLYQWLPKTTAPSPEAFPTGWTVPQEPSPCPKKAEKIYPIHDFHQGVYYYVFGSICGLQATPLASGNLHGPPAPVLEVFLDEDKSTPTNPKLKGRLVFGDFE